MWLKSNKGGISIFLTLLFMALLVFTGVLMDCARIFVAERKVQSALNSAARSVLAGYDEGLMGQFGLYGLEEKDEETVLHQELFRYFKGNLLERHQGIQFIRYGIEPKNISLSGTGALLSKGIFKQQILEYMKYKGPISLTEGAVAKFTQIKIGQKVSFLDKESQARGLGSGIKTSLRKFNTTVLELGKSIGKGGINNLKDSLKEKAESQLGQVISRLEKLKDDHITAKRHIEGLDQKVDEYLKAKAEADHAAKEAGAEATQSEFIRTKGDKAIVEERIDQNVRQLHQMLGVLQIRQQELKELQSQLKNLMDEPQTNQEAIKSKNTAIMGKVKEAQDIIDQMQLNEISEMQVGEKLTELEPPHQQDTENRKSFVEELKNTLSQDLLLQSLQATGGLISKEESWKENEEKELALGESMDHANNLSEEELEKQNTNIVNFLNRLKTLFSETALKARDNLYLTEYIMDKYTFLTSQTERGHYFNKGEVEFILYGQDVEAQNTVLSLGSVWFLRFGVDSVDYFVKSKIPHPVARLTWALIEGATQAFKDMYELCTTTQGCAICPSVPGVKISYSDHLRIFLLLKSEDTKLLRMQQLLQIDLMQENSTFRLGNCKTTIQAKAEVEVNLLFLPLLQLDKLKLPHFRGGKYIVKKEIITGY